MSPSLYYENILHRDKLQAQKQCFELRHSAVEMFLLWYLQTSTKEECFPSAFWCSMENIQIRLSPLGSWTHDRMDSLWLLWKTQTVGLYSFTPRQRRGHSKFTKMQEYRKTSSVKLTEMFWKGFFGIKKTPPTLVGGIYHVLRSTLHYKSSR